MRRKFARVSHCHARHTREIYEFCNFPLLFFFSQRPMDHKIPPIIMTDGPNHTVLGRVPIIYLFKSKYLSMQ